MGASASQASSLPAVLNIVPKNAATRAQSALRRGGYTNVVNDVAEIGNDVNTQNVQKLIQEQAEALLLRSCARDSSTTDLNDRVQDSVGTKTNLASECFTLCQTSAHGTGHIGEGVFLAGSNIPPGTVLAFFPGMTYMGIPPAATVEDPVAPWSSECSWDENDKTIDRSVLLPNCRSHYVHHVIERFCGGCVDGLQWERRRTNAYTMQLPVKQGDGSLPLLFSDLDNNFALGHMVNHPHADAVPNVMDWAVEFDVHLLASRGISRKYIPYFLWDTWYFSKEHGEQVAVPDNATIPGIVLLSTTSIAVGEQLLLDYNLHSESQPSWYTPRNQLRDARAEDTGQFDTM